MKKIFLFLAVGFLAIQLAAQKENPAGKSEDGKQEEEKVPFKEHLFTGGTVTVSFYNSGTVLGANPFFGYKIAEWVDAGIVFNYTYAGSRDNVYINDKIRQHIFGSGVFVRLYPARFLFFQAQPEHNFTNLTYTDPFGNKTKDKVDANSFLVGAGIAQGREPGSNTFYYISILVDVIKDKNSPYVNNVYNQTTGQLVRTDAIPIIRAGINIGLFEGKNRKK